MTVLFLNKQADDHPSHRELVRALGGRYPLKTYNPSLPLDPQLEGVRVVIDSGGAAGTREMIDAAKVAGVRLWQSTPYGLDHVDAGPTSRSGVCLWPTLPGP